MSGVGVNERSPAFGSVVLKIQDTFELEMIDLNCKNEQLSIFEI